MTSKKIGLLSSSHKFSRQRGASLLEGIAYLGIAAIVVLGAVSLLTGAFSGAKSNQMAEEIVAMRTAIRKLYVGQAYTGLTMAQLIAARAMPQTLTVAGGAATNSWGGAVAVAGTASNFTITYNAVPQEVCVSVLSGINGWTNISAPGNNAMNTMPVTAVTATAACSIDTAAGNTLVFTAS